MYRILKSQLRYNFAPNLKNTFLIFKTTRTFSTNQKIQEKEKENPVAKINFEIINTNINKTKISI